MYSSFLCLKSIFVYIIFHKKYSKGGTYYEDYKKW